MVKVALAPPAQIDLLEIGAYVAGHSGLEAAAKLLDLLHEKCQLLAKFPTMGRERNELLISLRSLAVGNYVIFYQPADDGIEVLRVLRGARDIPGIFDALGGE